MLKFVMIVCISVYLCSLFVQQSEQCIVRGSGDRDLPSFSDYGDSGVARITLHHQAIIPSYEFFDCCGNITEWGVDVQPGDNENMLYTLDLQVWRPSPTVDDSTGDGQYRLVGNNRFTSISLDGGVAQVTPLTRNQVQFRPGDVLGFYVEEAMDNMDGVNVLTTRYTSETVWYASVTSLNTMGCPVSVGSGGVLNTEFRGTPVISIDTETYNCPQITSTPPPCPTATTTTPQPTMPPTVPTDPGSITTTREQVSNEPSTEPMTDEPSTDTPSPVEPVTEDRGTVETESNYFKPMSLHPSPTEASHDSHKPLLTSPIMLFSTNNTYGSFMDSIIIIGILVPSVVFISIITITTTVIIISQRLKSKRQSIAVTTNPAYEIGILKSIRATNADRGDLHDRHVDASTDYEIVPNENVAYICSQGADSKRDDIATELNEAYVNNHVMERDNATSVSIVTKTNEAYISNSSTIANQVNSPGTVEVYDYINFNN